MELAGGDVGVGILGYVVDDDVPELAVGVVCPVAEEELVGQVGLHGSLGLALVGFGVGLAVGPADGGPHLCGKGYEVAVGRNHGPIGAEGVVGELARLARLQVVGKHLQPVVGHGGIVELGSVGAPLGGEALDALQGLVVDVERGLGGLALQVGRADVVGQLPLGRHRGGGGILHPIQVGDGESPFLGVGACGHQCAKQRREQDCFFHHSIMFW